MAVQAFKVTYICKLYVIWQFKNAVHILELELHLLTILLSIWHKS